MNNNFKNISLIAVFSIFSFSQELFAANVNFCGIEIKKRAAGTEFIPAYVDDLNATQKITQEKANAIVELIRSRLSQIESVVEASRKLIFQPKKVKGKMFGEMDNKNKLPDAAHLKSISDYITQLKAIPEAEIKAYLENTRRLGLERNAELAYKKKTRKYDRSIFSKAQEHELNDLRTRASSYLNMGQQGVAERQRKIAIAAQFLEELKPLLH